MICNAVASECRCAKEAGHVEAGDEMHVCGDTKRCGGSWTGTYEGDDFMPVLLPGASSDPVLGLLSLIFGGVRITDDVPNDWRRVLKEHRCWCGGPVGPREPGDEDGLGCLQDVNHLWRSPAGEAPC